MEKITYVGLDIHRKTVVATALSAEGTRIDQRTLGPSREELTRYLQELPGEDKRVVMEACTMWEPYFEAVEASGATASLSHPLKTRLIAEATIKTDTVDSAALANLLRLEAIPRAYAPPPELRRLRHLVRERLFFRRSAARMMNHIYAHWMHRGIPYETGCLRYAKGRKAAREGKIPEVDRALDTLDHLLTKVKELDREIHAVYVVSKEAQLLGTIPGLGEVVAVTLAAFLCPIERFANVEQVASYCGLVPTVHQSGESSYHGRLKRDCNHLLQSLLIEASWNHRRHAARGTVGRVAMRVSRRRGKGKGAVAAAHKLAKIAYAVLKRGTAYTPDAPERPAATRLAQNLRVAARVCGQGTALGPAAADRLLAQ